MNRLIPFAGTMTCVLAFGVPALALDEGSSIGTACAVSAVNAKIRAGGGFYEDQAVGSDGTGQATLSLSMPLGCDLGLQIDGAYGNLGGSDAGGVAAHLFLRDPTSHLFGAYASYSAVDNFGTTNDIFRIGAEGELYLEQFSFEGKIGYENADLGSNDWFTSLTAGFYVTDNVRITAGFRHFLSTDAGVVGVEWQPEGTGIPMSVFAKGQFGSNDFVSVTAGFSFYFGTGDKSLKRRHREDDPDDGILDMLKNVCETIFIPGNPGTDGKPTPPVIGNTCGSPPTTMTRGT